MRTAAKLSTAQLASMLRELADLVDAHDSFEGSLSYTALGDTYDDLGPDEWEVVAAYRIGNLGGQGGMRLIGGVM